MVFLSDMPKEATAMGFSAFNSDGAVRNQFLEYSSIVCCYSVDRC